MIQTVEGSWVCPENFALKQQTDKQKNNLAITRIYIKKCLDSDQPSVYSSRVIFFISCGHLKFMAAILDLV